MIIQLIIELFFGLFKLIIGLFDFTGINEATRNIPRYVIPDLFRYVAYFIDKHTFVSLLKAEFAWINFKIAWAVVMRIKSFIPTMSST